MAKFSLVYLGVFCFVSSFLLYSASLLKQSHPSKDGERGAGSTYRAYLFGSVSTTTEEDVTVTTPTTCNASLQTPSTVTIASQSPSAKTESKMALVASEALIQLQYTLGGSDTLRDSYFAEPPLFSMGRDTKTFTRYLEAILSDTAIDRKPFRELLRGFFPWWMPSANSTYLPWEPRSAPTTGIVLTAGQGNFVLAAHCIRVLRHVVNSTLPIQVFYSGNKDLPEVKREELRSLHPRLETIDILNHQFNETSAGLENSGYAMKPFAALASTFDRVILIDADTIFLQRPDAYFDEHAGLKKTGLHYFHDRAFRGRNTMEWVRPHMRGARPSSALSEGLFWQHELEHQQESGVVFINKAIPSAFMSLLYTTYMNNQVPRDKIYQNVVGDKETFWLASELSSAPYTFAPNYASIIGNLDIHGNTTSNDTTEMCSAQPLHLDHKGLPFWFNSGLRLEKDIDSREYVNLTHYLTGSRTTLEDQFEWRFRSHHTFCTSTEARKWLSLEKIGLKRVADEAVTEAKRVDLRFLGHEGGEHNDG